MDIQLDSKRTDKDGNERRGQDPQLPVLKSTAEKPTSVLHRILK